MPDITCCMPHNNAPYDSRDTTNDPANIKIMQKMLFVPAPSEEIPLPQYSVREQKRRIALVMKHGPTKYSCVPKVRTSFQFFVCEQKARLKQ